uniref:DH domain containing protein n=1 Tax=Echinococcus granulosus TaxID=6210 RepID=A0A068WQL8_ECHGR|nr:DH domain containing protein [Echinococcus granulosus]
MAKFSTAMPAQTPFGNSRPASPHLLVASNLKRQWHCLSQSSSSSPQDKDGKTPTNVHSNHPQHARLGRIPSGPGYDSGRASRSSHRSRLYEIADSRPRMASQEMTEVTSPFDQEDLSLLPSPSSFRHNSGADRRNSPSAMTISRDSSAGPVIRSSARPSRLDFGKTILASRKAIPPQMSRDYDSETKMAPGGANACPSSSEPPHSPTGFHSSCIRYRSKGSELITPERRSIYNGAYPEQVFPSKASIRWQMGQMLARSTPDINAACNPQATVQTDRLQNRLKDFEKGNLPKIPQNLLAVFPQNLQRHDFSVIEKMWNQLTVEENQDTVVNPNDLSKKAKDLQLSAVMELLYTEACYIKTLEMLIDVHIAVYLDLTKSTTGSHDYASRSGSLNRLSMVPSMDPIVPTELGPSTPTASTAGSHMHRRFRGRGSHDLTSCTSSLSNLSTLSLYDFPGFTAPPFEDVFGNIGTIYKVNHQFWTDCFEPGITNESAIDVKFCIRSMAKAFSQFASYFHPYINFLETYGTLISNIKYLDENNKFFSIYHRWTRSNNPLNSRESLSGLLAQPFQRLTRYGILIRRIKETTTDEYETSDLTEMLEAVEDFVKEVDVNQPKEESRTKLNEFIQRIHKYTTTDSIRSELNMELPAGSADIRSILRQPMRINGRLRTRKPIAEVQAKVKYTGGKISNALCMLLSDMILICKHSVVRRRIYVHRPPILLNNLTIQNKWDDPNSFAGIVTNDLGLVVDAYLFSSDGKDLKGWIYEVQQQKAKMVAMQQPNPVNQDVLSGFWQCHSNTGPSLGSLPPRKYDYNRLTSYECHSYITNRGIKRCGEVSRRPFLESFANSNGVIGRPQQLVDGSTLCSSKRPILPSRAISESETTLLERMKNGSSASVSKSASSASDSSAFSSSTSNTTNTATTSMSEESLGSIRSSPPTAVASKVRRPPRRMMKRGSTELVKTDSTDKRMTH